MNSIVKKDKPSLKITDFGAHLLEWKHWIFTSREAIFDGKKPIRGGVPIIFPQFNEIGSGQRHGFARTLSWQAIAEPEAGIDFAFELNESPATLAIWPHKFKARFTVSASNEQLKLELKIHNTDSKAFEFTCALHSYFNVKNVLNSQLIGLNGLNYWDNDGTDFSIRKRFEQDTLNFDGPIDRVYFGLTKPLRVNTDNGNISIEQSGFSDAVVWNPGPEAASQMVDMANDEWLQMLCIEAAQIDKPVILKPGESWSGVQIIQELAIS